MNPDTERSLPLGDALAPLLFIVSVFLLNFLTRMIAAPLMPELAAELGLNNAQSGAVFLCIALGNCVGLVCNAFVTARLTHREGIGCSALLMGSMLLVAASADSLAVLLPATVIIGVGAGLYLPSGVATVTSLTRPGDWGKALALHEMAPNGSFILAPLLAEAVLLVAGWRSVLLLLGVGQILLGLAFLRFGRGGRFHGRTPNRQNVGEVAGRRNFFLLTLLFCLGIAGGFGPYTMLPLHLMDMGMTREAANGLLSASRVGAFFVPFLTGWLADRFGVRRVLYAALGCSGCLAVVLGLAGPGWVAAPAALQPVFGQGFFAVGFVALSQTYEPQVRSTAISMILPTAMLFGIGVMPTLIGLFGDMGPAWGGFGGGFMLLGGLTLFGLPAVGALELPDRSPLRAAP
jgi:NNP family nitrate/nitrite transporter-like MFS transporter